MELIDFKEDEILNRLREKIGTNEFGHFELFDPDRHASWQEKQKLMQSLFQADGQHLKEAQSQLLYKNVKVIALYDHVFHFSYCDLLKKVSGKGQLSKIHVTASQKNLSGQGPCQYCLHNLDYQGFDVYRHRHQAHNEKVLKEFDVAAFLERYFIQEKR